MVFKVKSAGSRVDPVPRERRGHARGGRGRTSKIDATVRSFAFWLQSMKTPCRSSFHLSMVAIAGARRSTSGAGATAVPYIDQRPALADADVDVNVAGT
jgi:hypothetical protein